MSWAGEGRDVVAAAPEGHGADLARAVAEVAGDEDGAEVALRAAVLRHAGLVDVGDVPAYVLGAHRRPPGPHHAAARDLHPPHPRTAKSSRAGSRLGARIRKLSTSSSRTSSQSGPPSSTRPTASTSTAPRSTAARRREGRELLAGGPEEQHGGRSRGAGRAGDGLGRPPSTRSTCAKVAAGSANAARPRPAPRTPRAAPRRCAAAARSPRARRRAVRSRDHCTTGRHTARAHWGDDCDGPPAARHLRRPARLP